MCPASPMHMLNPNAQYDGIRSWGSLGDDYVTRVELS